MKFLIWTKKNSLLTSIVFGAILFLIVFFVPIYAYSAAIYNVSTSELIHEEGLITDSSIFNQIPLQPLKDFKIGLQFRKDFLEQGAISYSVYAYQTARTVIFYFGIYGSLLIAVIFTVLALINNKRASFWYVIEIIILLAITTFIYFIFFNIPNSFFNTLYVYEYYPFIGFFVLLALLACTIAYRALSKKLSLLKLSVPTSV